MDSIQGESLLYNWASLYLPFKFSKYTSLLKEEVKKDKGRGEKQKIGNIYRVKMAE